MTIIKIKAILKRNFALELVKTYPTFLLGNFPIGIGFAEQFFN